MNKRQKNKQNKRDLVNFALKINISDELKQDSIAHKIKSYFELDTITNNMMFKWDNENKKLLVSRKIVMYLLSLCNDVELNNDYNMEIVEKIDIFNKEG